VGDIVPDKRGADAVDAAAPRIAGDQAEGGFSGAVVRQPFREALACAPDQSPEVAETGIFKMAAVVNN
jgi:hypothetical protein